MNKHRRGAPRASAGFVRTRVSVDVRYINPFIEAVQSLFRTTLGADVLIGKPALKDKNAPPPEISALIAFSGGAAGHVGLCFSRTAAIRIASRYAEGKIGPEDAGLAGALGELANMVAGKVQAVMNGMDITVSLPHVLTGSRARHFSTKGKPVLVLPCDSQLGRFSVEVCMEPDRHEAGEPRTEPGTGFVPPLPNAAPFMR